MKNTVTFTLRRNLFDEFLTKMEKLHLDRILFGFQHSLIDPWPADPVKAWSLSAYMDDEDEGPDFICSVPVIRVADSGEEYERDRVVYCRYGLLDALRELWESGDSSSELLDLTVRAQESMEEISLEPIRLEANTTLHSHA